MVMRFTTDVHDPLVIDMLEQEGLVYTASCLNADIAVFVGGADVDPSIYGEENTHSSISKEHDFQSLCLYEGLYGKPMVGICRGAQFLTVMSGHRLHQHVNNHAINGVHYVEDLTSGETIRCTSTHHQMMRLKPDGPSDSVILAVGHQHNVGHDEPQIEAMWHPRGKSLCFQPHPEYVSRRHECRTLFMKYFDTYISGRLSA